MEIIILEKLSDIKTCQAVGWFVPRQGDSISPLSVGKNRLDMNGRAAVLVFDGERTIWNLFCSYVP